MRTRFAPSPTGDMHLGNARTAYFNWLIARCTGGDFILRIDDTDQARNNDQSTQVIFDTLRWLGLDYDLSFRQSDRTAHYIATVDYLLSKNKAKVVDGVTYLNNIDLPDQWTDSIAGDIKISEKDLESTSWMVLLRSDRSPTYHLASVIDDIDYGVDWIVRGKDHISNTPKHIAIYRALDASIPKFSHLGLLFKDKKKLSKRDNASSMLHYMNAGYDPDAMLNFMLRMGWGPKVDDKSTAILTRDDALRLFLDGGQMKNTDPNVDLDKLNSYDRKYKAKKKINDKV